MPTSRQAYLDSHPSLNASMSDYAAHDFSPTMPEMPSQHSGFRSNNGSEYSERSSSRRSLSPPQWRKAGSGWFKHRQSMSPNRAGHGSKDPSPQFTDDGADGDWRAYRRATKIPLPESPTKGRSPSHSPELETVPGANDEGGGDTTLVNNQIDAEPDTSGTKTPTESNYIRFTGSVQVQQKTDNIEAVVFYVRRVFHHARKSRTNMLFYLMGTIFIYWLFANLLSKPSSGPVPDLVKVAGLTKQFESGMQYSESGHEQIGELQETSIAVWDLSAMVRNSNMTSSATIVSQLEELSGSVEELTMALTQFFVGLDSDVDSILLVMEWANRELTRISQPTQSTLSTVWSNTHDLLARVGLVSGDRGIITVLLGKTQLQQDRATLEYAFTQFLNVMEETINSELKTSMRIWGLYELIDKQFRNLHSTVIREQDLEERFETDFLSSLWTRVVGANISRLRKFEKNRILLEKVHDRTVHNKGVLNEHQQSLRQMKSSLELLRRRLFSPLVRNTNASTLSVNEQIKGLEGTYNDLKRVRENQNSNKWAKVYAVRDRRDDLHVGTDVRSSSRAIGPR